MAQQQSSRLNRLLTLLDTGSTQATRFTAARQIGDIAKSHPQDLNSLLKKVSSYLHSKNWETRVAAAHAIGAIAQNVKHTSLADLFSSVGTKMTGSGISSYVNDVVVSPELHSKIVSGVSFRSFDINKVLEFGALMASGGQEYDIANDNLKNPKDRLARQKKNLKRRLGLDMCEQFMDVSDMIRDEDLVVQKYHQGNGLDDRFYTPPSVHNIQQFVSQMVPNVISKRRPSARELNMLKRKAKINSKDQAKGWSDDGDTELSPAHNLSIPRGTCPVPLGSSKFDAFTDDENSDLDGDGRWPFRSFVEQLILDMFDPVWEIRHGSVMALREILTHHGASAGVYLPDLNSDDTLFLEIKDTDFSSKIKKEREIDLNMQVSPDELEPDMKRPKLEDGSFSLMDKKISAGQHVGFDVADKIEDTPWTLPSGQFNGQHDISSMKMETELYDNDVICQSKEAEVEEQKSYYEDKAAFANSDDCAIRFLCVLTLDRFGDYVSDQVVAPVRETCAQALGATFKYMHPSLVHETLNVLLQMQCRPEWEIRHGSLLGIKYLVAVRREMLQDLLGYVLPACKAGLEDPDDDVRAVAADALIPAAAAIVALKGQLLHSIIMLLWDTT
ncbi:TATA-binding protein-associated factor BTAF1 [Hibiscus syriacus]|uniref:TATA-binding protein-associated factor BTAF1 n=1 Tax=Hibiscus syriacus TaxID=106335 RepID=A0A6A3BZV7_HIBSY|nr:TATA-binding protein-associated factor BTAF1 [Hibiscus syriacus]